MKFFPFGKYSLNEWRLIFGVSRLELLLKNVRSQGAKNSRFSPKGLTTRKIQDVKLCMLMITNW